MNFWEEEKGDYLTPGGDPAWKCPKCGKGEHVYGVESPGKKEFCPDCKARLFYPQDVKNIPFSKVLEELQMKDCAYVEERMILPEGDDIFSGLFTVKNGTIESLDGDSYSMDQIVACYDVWTAKHEGHYVKPGDKCITIYIEVEVEEL